MRRVLLGCALLTGCITSRPVLRAPQPMPVAAAFVMDYPDRTSVGAVPGAVVEQVQSVLQTHNMTMQPLAFSTYATDFASRRLTIARLTGLADMTPEAKTLLLVETKVSFYSELNNLFRWDVYAKVTIADAHKLDKAVSTEKTFAIFMDFEHEREDAVLTSASSDIRDEVSRVASDFLGIVLPPVEGQSPAPAKQSRWDPNRDAIYFVLIDRFSNGDPSNDGDVDLHDPQAFHGGDLQGVLNKLDYIQSMGFTTIWLSPVFKMRTTKHFGHGAFHGYWVEDFTKIEPRFGTEELLVKLSNEIHRRGMKLLLDVVLNHVAHDSPLVTEHPEWFHHNGDIKDWNDLKQLTDNDIHGLPDLAQEREDVYQYLLKTSLYWIDHAHPDGFRLDAVKHIPSSFWARYNDDIRAHAGQDFMLLGEDLDGNPGHIAHELKEGRFTSLFDFPLHYAMLDVACHNANHERLAATLFEDREYAHPELLVTLLDNHDLPRLAASCGNDSAAIETALHMLFTTRGIPSMTYGTEAGLNGADDPINRADMPWDASTSLVPLIRSLLQARPKTPYTPLVVQADRGVRFEASAAPLAAGDRLFLAGGLAELGGWDPGHALGPFVAGSAGLSLEAQLPANGVFEAKLYIRRHDGSDQWESSGNRYLATADGCETLRWNEADGQVKAPCEDSSSGLR